MESLSKSTSFETPFWIRLFKPLNPLIASIINSVTWHFRKQNRIAKFGDLTFFTALELQNPHFDFSSRILMAYINQLNLNGKSVLDINSGTGCVAISAARSGAMVTAFDQRALAISLIAKNAELNAVRAEIKIVRGDIFARNLETEKFDFILYQNDRQLNLQESENVGNFFKMASLNVGESGKIVFVPPTGWPVPQMIDLIQKHGFKLGNHQRFIRFFEQFFILEFERN
ncbi:MAG: methyltransferase domain-containing protein [Calditrichaeota bacterium]|nr:MAG: methyltransferase domain-containing protein [Calditrichota bacterium]